MYRHLLIHLPIEGHLDCFQFWAIIDKRTIKIACWILCGHSFQISWINT